jgi:ATP-dependent protease ClpP protease subunit
MQYSKLLDFLYSATESDQVDMFFATPGGMMESCRAILDAMAITKAHIRGIHVGSASSAGSMILLGCDEQIILPGATMMIHTASHGYGGTDNNINAYASFSNKWVNKFVHEVYEGFLSEDEIEKVIMGMEFWFDAEQIIERLQKRKEYFEAMELLQSAAPAKKVASKKVPAKKVAARKK